MITPEQFIQAIKISLLKKYDAKPNSSIRLHYREKVMFPYTDNTPIGIVDIVHCELKVLENDGLIEIKWKTDNELIQYITLIEPLQLADSIGYQLLSYKCENAINHLQHQLTQSYHYKLLAPEIMKQWRNKGRYEGFSVDEPNVLCEAIKAADALKSRSIEDDLEIDERYFSSNVFSDSKRFSQIHSRVAKILKLTEPLLPEDIEPGDIFRLYGVVPIKHPIYISGPVDIFSNNSKSVTAEFLPAIGVWPDYIESITGEIKTLTTIENLATFNRYVQQERVKDEVVLYTAGIPSPAIKKIYSLLISLEPLKIRHWSDIDIGGFTILSILEKIAKQPVAGFRMSFSDYENIPPFGEITDKQAERLMKLAQYLTPDNQILAFELSDKKITYEQESYLSFKTLLESTPELNYPRHG